MKICIAEAIKIPHSRGKYGCIVEKIKISQ